MAVRSAQLAVGTAANGSYGTIYTVGADERTIVKRVTCFNGSGATRAVAVRVAKTGGAVGFLGYAAALGSAGILDIDTWHVMNVGDELQVFTDGTPVYVIASGAELVV